MMFKIAFSHLRLNPEGVSKEELGTFLGQVSNLFADVSISSEGEILYEDDEFPVAEFSWQLREWLHDGISEEFIFDSMFFEREEVRIIPNGGDLLVKSSMIPHEGRRIEPTTVHHGVMEFVRKLDDECSSKYQVKLA